MPRRAFPNHASNLRSLTGSVVLLVAISQIAIAAPGFHRIPAAFTPKIRPQNPQVNGISSDPRAFNLLRQMLEAESRLSFSGKQVTFLTRSGKDVNSEQQVTRVGTRSIRIDYTDARFSGEQIIDNGKFYWHYVPRRNTLEVTPSRIGRMETRSKQVIQQLQRGVLAVDWIGQEQMAGHNCGIIEVYPTRVPNPIKRRFWVDSSNGAQLKIEQYGQNRELVSSSYFTEIDYTPKIRPETFNPPNPPKSVRTIAPPMAQPLPSIEAAQAQAGFSVLQPKYVPTGFRYQSVSGSNFRNHPIVGLRYANGLNFLSLFETPVQIGMDNDKEIQHPRPGVAIGQQSGMRIILVGNLAPEELEKIIRSVR